MKENNIVKKLITRIEEIDYLDKKFFENALKEGNTLCIELDNSRFEIYYTEKEE